MNRSNFNRIADGRTWNFFGALMLALLAIACACAVMAGAGCSTREVDGVIKTRNFLNETAFDAARAEVRDTNGTIRKIEVEGYKSDQSRALETINKLADALKALAAPKP